jgi:hypothetical protein
MDEWELSSLLDLLAAAPRQNPGGGEQLRERAAALQRQVRKFQADAARLHGPHYTIAPNQTRRLVDDLMGGADEAVTFSTAAASALSRRTTSPAARVESAIIHEIKRCTGSEHFNELAEIFSVLSGQVIDPESLCRRPSVTRLPPPGIQRWSGGEPPQQGGSRPELLLEVRETIFRPRRAEAAIE